MNRILVTGGLGFIGAHLCRRLAARGTEVCILDNLLDQVHGSPPKFDEELVRLPGVRFIRGDVTSRETLREALGNVSRVVHLAAETGTGQSMYEIGRYAEVNGLGTAILLEEMSAMPARPLRLVLASSRAVYGEGLYACAKCDPPRPITPPARSRERLEQGRWEPACERCGQPLAALPTPESARAHPASVYAATKLFQEHLASAACAAWGVPLAILRFQNVYGEGQSLRNPYTGILSIFANRARQAMPLEVYEDGQETRDFVHVADAVAAIVSCLDRPEGDDFTLNIGSGEATTIHALAQRLLKALGSEVPVLITGQCRLGDVRHSSADIAQARRLLGFEPQVGLDQGLRRFCAWVEQQRAEPDRSGAAVRELAARGLMPE